MPKTIVLEPHLTKDELHKRYRDCRAHNEKLRWKALHLIATGVRAADAARRLRFGRRVGSANSPPAITKTPPTAADKIPSRARGQEPTLTAELSLELAAALHKGAPDSRLWTANKSSRGSKPRHGGEFTRTTLSARRAMRAAGLTLQRPRPASTTRRRRRTSKRGGKKTNRPRRASANRKGGANGGSIGGGRARESDCRP